VPRKLPDAGWHKRTEANCQKLIKKSQSWAWVIQTSNIKKTEHKRDETGNLMTMDKVHHLTLPSGDRITAQWESMRLGSPCLCPSDSCDCDGCEKSTILW
jgi:hypothetical protein